MGTGFYADTLPLPPPHAGSLYKMVVTVQDAAGSTHDLAVAVWSRPWLARSNDVEEQKQAWILNSAAEA